MTYTCYYSQIQLASTNYVKLIANEFYVYDNTGFLIGITKRIIL